MNGRQLSTLTLALAALVTEARAQCPDLDLRFRTPRSGFVECLAEYDAGARPRLFAGGTFVGLARWDGVDWADIQSGPIGSVSALLVHDFGAGPVLVVGGNFVSAGGVNVQNIATWNGTSWGGIGAGFDGMVDALCVHDFGAGPRVVAGGSFTNSGATPVARIAVFDGAAWQPLASGMDDSVRALAVYDDGAGPKLVAGGNFTQAGGFAAANIARFNGTSWSPLAGGTDSGVASLLALPAAAGGGLVVGGSFQQAGATAAKFVARFDGAQWHTFGAGLSGFFGLGSVSTLIADGSGFIAGGVFQTPTATPTNLVARWDGTQWLDLGAGLGTQNFQGVAALVRHDPQDGGGMRLFAGGAVIHGIQTRSLVQWNGVSWTGIREASALGIPCSAGGAGVWSVTGWQADLVVAGEFDSVGEVLDANGVARFDGERWHAMHGAPVTAAVEHASLVEAIELSGAAELVLGLTLSTTAGDSRVPLYRWTGTSWVAFEPGAPPIGISRSIQDVLVHDDGSGPKLYAAGDGLEAQSSGVLESVVRWNGSAWERLAQVPSPSLSGLVLRMVSYDDGTGPALYACGYMPGGVQRWNGTTWSVVGTGFSDTVSALQAFDDGFGMKLYASGTFLQAGAVTVNGIARWNGSAWEPCPGVGNQFAGKISLGVLDDRSGSGAKLYATNFNDDLEVFSGGTWSLVAVTDPYFTFTRMTVVNAAPGGRAIVLHGTFQEVFELGQAAMPQVGLTLWRACPGVSTFCTGDGLDPALTVGCPCANSGAAGHGCAWDTGTSGGRLSELGSPDADDLVLVADDLPVGGFSLFFQGGSTIAAGLSFGDGILCASTPITRLRVKANPAGSARVPDTGDPRLSVLGSVLPGSNVNRHYQVWFRASAPFCTNATYNTTNALRVGW